MGRTALATKAARGMTPAAAIASRNEALTAMPTALRRVCEQIVKGGETQRQTNIRYYYNLGTKIQEIKSDVEAGGKKFTVNEAGDQVNPLKLLEQAIATHARTMRMARQFANMYTPEKLEWILALYNEEADFRLHWGHIKFLMTIIDERRRDEFAERAVKRLWDPDELHKQIQKTLGARGPGNSVHKVPATVAAQLRQLRNLTDTWIKKNKQVWSGETNNLFSKMIEEPADNITDEFLETAQQTLALLQTLETEVAEVTNAMARSLEHCTGAHKAAAEAAERARLHEQALNKPQPRGRAVDLSESVIPPQVNPPATPRRRRAATV